MTPAAPVRRRRLSRSGDFQRAYRNGSSRSNRFAVIYAFPRSGGEEGDGNRLGVSVGRKVGNAVTRNRVKRMLREAFWAAEDRIPTDHDFVIVARGESAEAIERIDATELSSELSALAIDAAGASR